MNSKNFTPLFLILFLFPILSNAQFGCYDVVLFDSVDVYLNHDGIGSVWKGDILNNPDYCPDYADIEIYAPNGDSLGHFASCLYLNQVLDVKVIHPTSQAFAWSTVIPRDTLGPYIACQDTFTYCLSDTSPDGVGVPFMQDNCTSVDSYSYTDEEIYFDCGVVDFQNYFDPSNWCLVSCNWNGFVDTSLAPQSIEVHGAHDLPPLDIGAYLTRYKITIPAEGYFSFDWAVSGVNSAMDIAYFTINDTCLVLNTPDTLANHFDSWLLQAGDVISFDIKSDGDALAFALFVENLVFSTAAEKVIYRTWTAVDALGNVNSCTQNIVVYRVFDQDIFFPPNHGILTNNAFACDESMDPLNTGFPFVDVDGDLLTTDDQLEINNTSCIQATYTDVVFDACGDSKKIARTWTVLSDCSDEIETHTQLIEFIDEIAPTWACSTDTIFVSTNGAGCTADFTLPLPDVSDDGCTNDIAIDIQSILGNGVGPFNNVNMGTYVFTLTATDDCGNSALCTQVVKIIDTTSPTMVCQEHIIATIGTLGSIDVYPVSFDDGSYDNCCLAGFEVLRMDDVNGSYQPFVTFDCSDIGAMKYVYLKATDCYGLSNICTVEVEIQDNVAPVMICPADQNISCAAGYSNLEQYGAPVVTDNCDFTLEYTTTESTNNCGIGQIIRSWTATDASGLVTSCQQVLNIVNTNPWNSNNDQIVWPQDLDLSECNGSLEPDALDIAYAFPQFNSPSACALIATNYTDEVFTVAGDACFQVNRTWTVDDFCQSNNGTGNGVWQHLQILRVIDNNPPVFENVEDGLVYEILSDNCLGEVTIPMPTIVDCNPNIDVLATSSLGTGFGPFYDVPQGDYEVTFQANDGCGNTSEEMIVLHVVDGKDPSPYCFGQQIFILENTGQGAQVAINANQLNLNSSDNCTDPEDLIYSFSSDINDTQMILDCDDIGFLALDMWVTDLAGNQSYCTTTIQVQDNAGYCQGNTGIVLSGQINTPSDEPVALVEVEGTFTNNSIMTTTPLSGIYAFDNVMPGEDVNVIPYKNINPRNGLTSYDLSLLENHIMGISNLASPYTLIGADINNDQIIDSLDWQLLKDMILFNIEEWSAVPSWRFVPEAFTFSDPLNPFLTPFPESASVLNIANSVTDINFVGIKMGDFDQSVDPTQLVDLGQEIQSNVGVRSNKQVEFIVEDAFLEVGKSYSISIRLGACDYGMSSTQFTVDYDPLALDFVDVETSDMDPFNGHNTGFRFADEGKLTFVKLFRGNTAQQGDIIYQFRVKAKRNIYLHDVLDVNSVLTKAMAYLPFEHNEAASISLVFVDGAGNPIKEDNTFELLSNFPNPFDDYTYIEYRNSKEESVLLEVFTSDGRLILSQQYTSRNGLNRIPLTSDLFGQEGVYFYRLTTAATSKVKALVFGGGRQ